MDNREAFSQGMAGKDSQTRWHLNVDEFLYQNFQEESWSHLVTKSSAEEHELLQIYNVVRASAVLQSAAASGFEH